MKPRFLQLLAEQHAAQLALESAVDRLVTAEEQLIAGNPQIPEVTRHRGRTAALEFVQLVVDRKIKDLAELPLNAAPVFVDMLATLHPLGRRPSESPNAVMVNSECEV